MNQFEINGMRTITVRGSAKLSVLPDTCIVRIDEERMLPTYEEALKACAEDKQALDETLAALGVEKALLKTVSFRVEEQREQYWEYNKNMQKEWHTRSKGFTYYHRLRMEFPTDPQLLSRVMAGCSKCPGSPAFEVQYTIADRAALTEKLQTMAGQDALRTARTLTAAVGAELGNVVSISYKEPDHNYYYEDLCCEAASCAEPKEPGLREMDVTPQEIELSDSVEVIWEIAARPKDRAVVSD